MSESLEVRIVEKLIEVIESPLTDKKHDEELFRMLAKYRSRLSYIEKQYRKERQ